MHLKLQQIGNSIGIILPREEITKRGLQVGDSIDFELLDDPFWDELAQYSKEDRRLADKQDNLETDDLSEWENL